MKYIIREIVVFCFIAAVGVLSGCGSAEADRHTAANANRPLVLPKVSTNLPKIIAFGDSLTAGFGLAETESYPFLLQRRLISDGFDYEVVNAGVSGDTSLGGAERARWVLEQENAEIVILALGANDLLRGMPVDSMKKNLASILELAKEKNIKVLLCGMLAPESVGAEYQREYVSAFSDLAKEYDVEFMPFLLEGVALEKSLNQADGIHPNAEGTRRMTANIYRALRPLLKDDAGKN